MVDAQLRDIPDNDVEVGSMFSSSGQIFNRSLVDGDDSLVNVGGIVNPPSLDTN